VTPAPPNPSSALRDLMRSGEAGRLRSSAGISQATMAAGLGISRQRLSRLECGYGSSPGLAFAGRWLRVLRGLANHEAVTRELAAQRRAA
jgi:transcriptional regulator with XRE-family HTH domain